MYNVLPITVIVLILYGISFVLMKKSIISIANHKYWWNIILLVAFLISGLLGLVLALMIDQQIIIKGYHNLLKLHVEFGIIMALICLFHVVWHTRYYLCKFKKQSIHDKNKICD